MNVSSPVKVTQSGFGLNRGTGFWTATMTVTNNSGSAITGATEVVLTSVPSNATMVNYSGVHNGSPYITVLAPGGLAVGASVTVTIQFLNPSAGYISFTPVTYSGMF